MGCGGDPGPPFSSQLARNDGVKSRAEVQDYRKRSGSGWITAEVRQGPEDQQYSVIFTKHTVIDIYLEFL